MNIIENIIKIKELAEQTEKIARKNMVLSNNTGISKAEYENQINKMQNIIDEKNERIEFLENLVNSKDMIIRKQLEQIDYLEKQKREISHSVKPESFFSFSSGNKVKIKNNAQKYWSVIGNLYTIPDSYRNMKWEVKGKSGNRIKIQSSSGIAIFINPEDVHKI